MKEQTGESYLSSQYAKSLMASEAKIGKTMFIIASLLGCLPNQKKGAVVSRPKFLHVLSFDSGALSGIRRFLTESCQAPAEALNFRVYNMQDDMRKAAVGTGDYDRTFYNQIQTVLHTVRERAAAEPGVHALHISSLTGMVEGLLRSVSGPAAQKKGGGMDQSKWGDFAGQVTELRNFAQLDLWHCIWEAHIYTPAPTGQGSEQEVPKETLQIPGKSGQNFPFNVEQVFRIRREFGNTYDGTSVDKTHMDTRASLAFAAGGRNFTEALKAKEYDMTSAFERLGLKTGNWGRKSSDEGEVVKKKKKVA